MAKRGRKPKVNPETPKRPVGRPRTRPKDSTLPEIAARVKEGGALTPEEMKAINQVKRSVDQIPMRIVSGPGSGAQPKFDLKKSLAEIEEKIFQAYQIEMTHGKGIAKIQAADRLREWADILGVHEHTAEPTTISFLPAEVDQVGKVVQIETA